jgi:flavin-dependent dehydrogenase
MTEKTIAIIGGGIAGSAAAITLRKLGLKVAIVSRPTTDKPGVGEYLNARAKPLLSRLGVATVLSNIRHRRCSLVQSSWGSNELLHKHSLQSPWGDSYVLDRKLFDRQLLKAAINHDSSFIHGKFLSANRKDNIWRIEYKDETGCRQILSSNFLVDATGRSAVVARSLGESLVHQDQLVAVIGIVKTASTSSLAMGVTIEACPDGWFYSTPIRERQCVVNFYTSADQIRAQRTAAEQFLFEKIWESTHTSEKLLRNSEVEIENVQVCSARPQRLDHSCGDDWIAIGDAATSYDPMAADGICRALENGIEAGQTILQYFADDRASLVRLAAQARSDYEKHLVRRQHFYSAEHRWPDSEFWSQFHESPGSSIDEQSQFAGIHTTT